MAKSFYSEKVVLEYNINYQEVYDEIFSTMLEEDEEEDVETMVSYFEEWLDNDYFHRLDDIETSAACEYDLVDGMIRGFKRYAKERIENKESEV